MSRLLCGDCLASRRDHCGHCRCGTGSLRAPCHTGHAPGECGNLARPLTAAQKRNREPRECVGCRRARRAYGRSRAARQAVSGLVSMSGGAGPWVAVWQAFIEHRQRVSAFVSRAGFPDSPPCVQALLRDEALVLPAGGARPRYARKKAERLKYVPIFNRTTWGEQPPGEVHREQALLGGRRKDFPALLRYAEDMLAGQGLLRRPGADDEVTYAFLRTREGAPRQLAHADVPFAELENRAWPGHVPLAFLLALEEGARFHYLEPTGRVRTLRLEPFEMAVFLPWTVHCGAAYGGGPALRLHGYAMGAGFYADPEQQSTAPHEALDRWFALHLD